MEAAAGLAAAMAVGAEGMGRQVEHRHLACVSLEQNHIVRCCSTICTVRDAALVSRVALFCLH